MYDEDDDAAWEGWDVESESGSDSDGWISVDSDDEDLVISDSDDEKGAKSKQRKEKQIDGDTEMQDDDSKSDPLRAVEPVRVSTLATTKVRPYPKVYQLKSLTACITLQILTPADFALLNDLKIKAAEAQAEIGGGPAKRKLAELQSIKKSNTAEGESTFLSEADLLGPRKKAKQNYEERIASIQEGREGREKFGSRKGKNKKETGASTTNREKRKNKPMMMVMASQSVRSKKTSSLADKRRRIRNHIDTAKKAHH